MTRQADFVERWRMEAWAEGRPIQESLLTEFCRRHGDKEPPAPALIADELITDFLHADLRFDPLDLNIFAQTESVDDILTVTINSRIEQMPNVIDHEGVANVAKLHEIIHLIKDAPSLKIQPALPLPGMAAAAPIICYRGDYHRLTGATLSREFWAEEAGRAAAVSYRALARSKAFRRLQGLKGRLSGPYGWELIAEAARDIGINRSALARQLELENRIAIVQEDSRQVLYIQPGLDEIRR